MKTRNPKADTFSTFVCRGFSDSEIEVVIEIEEYEPAEKSTGRDTPDFGGRVTFGNSFNLAGEHFPLRELEIETAKEAFYRQIESQPEPEPDHDVAMRSRHDL